MGRLQPPCHSRTRVLQAPVCLEKYQRRPYLSMYRPPPCSLESCTSPPGTLMPVTAEDIAAYLDAQDDFDLELFVHRSLVMSGFHSEHAGSYDDPATGRPQRFDVRARRFF